MQRTWNMAVLYDLSALTLSATLCNRLKDNAHVARLHSQQEAFLRSETVYLHNNTTAAIGVAASNVIYMMGCRGRGAKREMQRTVGRLPLASLANWRRCACLQPCYVLQRAAKSERHTLLLISAPPRQPKTKKSVICLSPHLASTSHMQRTTITRCETMIYHSISAISA